MRFHPVIGALRSVLHRLPQPGNPADGCGFVFELVKLFNGATCARPSSGLFKLVEFVFIILFFSSGSSATSEFVELV